VPEMTLDWGFDYGEGRAYKSLTALPSATYQAKQENSNSEMPQYWGKWTNLGMPR